MITDSFTKTQHVGEDWESKELLTQYWEPGLVKAVTFPQSGTLSMEKYKLQENIPMFVKKCPESIENQARAILGG